LLLALYSPALFYNLELTDAPHTTALVMFALVMAEIFGRRRQHARYMMAAGLAIGLATWARPNVLIVLAGIAVWLLQFRLPRQVRRRGIAVMVLSSALVLAWPSYHNLRATGRFALTTTTGPYNLYIGNNPNTTGVFMAVPDELKDAIERGETSYTAEVVSYITSQPLDWLQLMVEKTAMVIAASDMELGSNVNYHYWGVRYSPLLRITGWVVHFELLALLAVTGLVLIRQRKGVGLLYLTLGSYTAGMILFFMQARIRMAFVPVIILLAVKTVDEMIRRWRRGDRLIGVVALAILVAYLILLVRYAYLLAGGIRIVS